MVYFYDHITSIILILYLLMNKLRKNLTVFLLGQGGMIQVIREAIVRYIKLCTEKDDMTGTSPHFSRTIGVRALSIM